MFRLTLITCWQIANWTKECKWPPLEYVSKIRSQTKIISVLKFNKLAKSRYLISILYFSLKVLSSYVERIKTNCLLLSCFWSTSREKKSGRTLMLFEAAIQEIIRAVVSCCQLLWSERRELKSLTKVEQKTKRGHALLSYNFW